MLSEKSLWNHDHARACLIAAIFDFWKFKENSLKILTNYLFPATKAIPKTNRLCFSPQNHSQTKQAIAGPASSFASYHKNQSQTKQAIVGPASSFASHQLYTQLNTNSYQTKHNLYTKLNTKLNISTQIQLTLPT